MICTTSEQDAVLENEAQILVTVKKKPVYEAVKRVADVVLSLFALVVLSPIFLVTAIAIKLEDGGDIIYAQSRVTKGGRLFTMYKFRSMCMNADALLAQLQAQNEMTGPTFKMENDPRITKVGRVIRRTSIDELPQLVNVLKGDMTIIGPRPPIASEVESYNDYQKQRLLVKTGLACYHECRGRSTIKDFDRWVEMDLEYIQERGLWTDVKIILKTIVVVLSRKGAE
jgi:lipopolysaccharide/colanic/teichoic acid biosynthesis glycosyltransferase